MAQLNINEILSVLGNRVIGQVGQLKHPIQRPAPFNSASAGTITFYNRQIDAWAEGLERCRASLVLCGFDTSIIPEKEDAPMYVQVTDPRACFILIMKAFFEKKPTYGIHPTAIIHQNATIAEDVFIGPYVVVDADCGIGSGCIIHAHVHLYEKTSIGRNVTIHSGTVIGAEGFGYERTEDGEVLKFPHIGGVVIEDDVEIGSNTSIDRGTLENTVISRHSKIDNQVHISHNVEVGERVFVIAQSMIGGSTKLGAGVWIAPSACLLNGLTVGADVTVGMGAVVVKDVPAGATVAGLSARQIPT